MNYHKTKKEFPKCGDLGNSSRNSEMKCGVVEGNIYENSKHVIVYVFTENKILTSNYLKADNRISRA
jgi:hypothetical protein